MINRIFKIIAYISVAFLVYFDIYVLFTAISSGNGQEVFNAVLEGLVPCSLLVGGTVFFALIESKAKKPMAIISLVINGIMLVLRLLVLVVMVVEFTGRTEALYTDEITYLVSLLAYTVLLAANIFLMIYLLKGKFVRTCRALIGVSAASLLIDFCIIAYINISTYLELGGTGIFASIASGFNEYNSLQSIIAVVAYVMIYAAATNVFSEERQTKNG